MSGCLAFGEIFNLKCFITFTSKCNLTFSSRGYIHLSRCPDVLLSSEIVLGEVQEPNDWPVQISLRRSICRCALGQDTLPAMPLVNMMNVGWWLHRHQSVPQAVEHHQ